MRHEHESSQKQRQETCKQKKKTDQQLTLGSKGVPNPVFYLDSIAIWSRWTLHTYPLLTIHCNSRCTVQCDQGIFLSTSNKDSLVTMGFNYNLCATLHATSSASATSTSTAFVIWRERKKEMERNEWENEIEQEMNRMYVKVDTFLVKKEQTCAHLYRTSASSSSTTASTATSTTSTSVVVRFIKKYKRANVIC